MEMILAAALPYLISVAQNVSWMVLCVYFEGRSEPMEDQIAICQVIMNRVIRYDESAMEIIQKPKQFSWLNNNERPAVDDYKSLGRAIAAVNICLNLRQDGKDLFGADHYFARYIAPPLWAKDMKLVWSGKTHSYYREH